MRSTNDAIAGLKKKLIEWEIVNEDELKEIDKEARSEVDAEVAEAEKAPFPEAKDKILFEDIYVSHYLIFRYNSEWFALQTVIDFC